MKMSLLKLLVIWRRFQRGSLHRKKHHFQYAAQVEGLMQRANPFAGWNERANWMIDVAQWLRRSPSVTALHGNAGHHAEHQRIRFLLDWLDHHRDMRRIVQTTLQKTLREAVGPELFSATGLPREPAFFSELSERLIKKFLPKPPAQQDLSTLFTSMFPQPADGEWLLAMDHETLSRIWRLCADNGIEHNYRQQVDEALLYLAIMIVSVGIGADFRERLEPRMPLQATPFMALRRELEKYLLADAQDEGALRSVRMLIAVCQAQTDRIYAHLDEYGVSVGLVYRIERMRAQLGRMARLIALRSSQYDTQSIVQVKALLGDLMDAHHHRSSIRGLIHRSFSLLARKMVERNANHGEQYIARDRTEYRAMLKAACIGGVITVLAVLGKFVLSDAGLARFFEGAFASLNYVVAFFVIAALGGTLATKQPAVTAPALASKMEALDTKEGLRALLLEIACLLRSQAAAVFGNLIAVVPVMAAISLVISVSSGGPMMPVEKAHAVLQTFSALGPTPLFAAFTGILLWVSSLFAGFADNWFALHQLRSALANDRRMVHALGAARAERWATWLENRVAGIVGNLSLGILLGMSPVIAQFFGLMLDVRHVTLAAGAFTAAVSSLGSAVLTSSEFWLGVGGILLIGLFNVGVAFSCALALALQAREVPKRVQRLVFRAVFRRFAASPRLFLFPEKQEEATVTNVPVQSAIPETEEIRSNVR